MRHSNFFSAESRLSRLPAVLPRTSAAAMSDPADATLTNNNDARAGACFATTDAAHSPKGAAMTAPETTAQSPSSIPGYDYGQVSPAPITMEQFVHLKRALGFTADDTDYLRMAAEVLCPRFDDIMADVMSKMGFIFQPQVSDVKTGRPISHYVERQKMRLRQWLMDTCTRDYDQDWLNYMYESGCRHVALKKNRTDHAEGAPEHVPFRYLLTTLALDILIRPWLEIDGRFEKQVVDKIHAAWTKSLCLQVAIMSKVYVPDGLW